MHTLLKIHQQNCQKNGNNSYQTMTTRLGVLLSECQKAKHAAPTGSSDLFLRGQLSFIDISITVDSSPIPAFSSPQEDADTRIMLNCFHVATSCSSNLIVRSPDTDVFLLLLYYGNRMGQNVYFDTGFTNKIRLMGLKCLIRKRSELMYSAMLALHAFSGVRLYRHIHSRGENHSQKDFGKACCVCGCFRDS